MHYFKLPYILYRDYPDFGYLTDNRNYGYDTASGSCIKVGDRILSKTGSVFYSVLTERPQTVDDLSRKIASMFVGVSDSEVKTDAEAFFEELAKDGFVGAGECVPLFVDCFSYADKHRRDLPQEEYRANKDEEFSSYWGAQYHLSRVHLEVSGRCNEHCVHCYFPDSFNKSVMTRELFLSILEQCKACNVLSITISGGEPMLNPDLLFFINECRKNNFSVNLLSNLTLLSEDMLRVFSRTPLFGIQTSLYSMVPDVHDSITRVKGSFEKTKRAIEKLHEYNIPMQINCPVIKQNKNTYQDVLDWASNLNIEASSDYLVFGCFDGSSANLRCRLELSEIESIIREGHRGGNKESNQGQGNGNYTICPVCISSLCVSHAGDIYPCEGWQSYNLGNVKNTPLKKIWEESREIQALRDLSYDDFPKCRNCVDKDFCSICLLRNANESRMGDYKEVNPYFCRVARVKRAIAANDVGNISI